MKPVIAMICGLVVLMVCVLPSCAETAVNDNLHVYGCDLSGVSSNVLSNDVGVTPASTVMITQYPAHGHLETDGDAKFIYYWGPDFGFLGNDIVKYRIDNGTALSNEATVTISVDSWGGGIGDFHFTTLKNTPLSKSLHWSDTHQFASIYSTTQHGTTVFDTPWDSGYFTFDYSPANNFVGDDQFTWSVISDTQDGRCWSPVSTVYINVVDPAPEFPSQVIPFVFIIGFAGVLFAIREIRK